MLLQDETQKEQNQKRLNNQWLWISDSCILRSILAKKQKMLEDYWRIFKKIRKSGYKSEEQKETLANINKLCNARDDVIQLFNDYTTIACEVRYKASKGKGIKILTQNKCFKDYQ